MMKKPQRKLPWTALLEALLEDICRYSGIEPQDPIPSLKVERLRGATHPALATPDNRANLTGEDLLIESYKDLQRAKYKIEHALLMLGRDATLGGVNDLYGRNPGINDLDQQVLRTMRLEGREGWARIIENGGYFGPKTGQKLADFLRKEATFSAGQGSSLEEERERLFAIKRVATIQHLYYLGLKKAVTFYCLNNFPEDVEEKKFETVLSWVKRRRKTAKEELGRSDLAERDRRNHQGILTGLCPDAPSKALLGQPYEALEPFISEYGKNN
jgi:hypothetical protein